MKGKALRRALAADPVRVNADLPLITDTTELVTPDTARTLLQQNRHNRPINWRKVELYADAMRRGEWKLHGQGIMLDAAGNVLTGQKRLWAVVYSDTPVYFRISRGNPAETATLIDRGDPQTARDLAARVSERRHAPTETSIARALCALLGNSRPTVDQLAEVLAAHGDVLEILSKGLRRVRKQKAVLMMAGALASRETAIAARWVGHLEDLAQAFEAQLLPHRADECWNRGASFGLAMEKADALLVARGCSA